MNNLIADVLRALPAGTNLTTALMVIDYILCTTPVAVGEEGEVLTHVLDITKLLRLDWGPVFAPDIVALALMGQVPTATGNVDKGIATTHKGICKKRASLYNEKEAGICTMAETVRATFLPGVPHGCDCQRVLATPVGVVATGTTPSI
jgi:hypothetical protein